MLFYETQTGVHETRLPLQLKTSRKLKLTTEGVKKINTLKLINMLIVFAHQLQTGLFQSD